MDVKIVKVNGTDHLQVTVPLHTAEASSTGRTMNVAYEQAKEAVSWNGHPLTVQVTGYYKPSAK